MKELGVLVQNTSWGNCFRGNNPDIAIARYSDIHRVDEKKSQGKILRLISTFWILRLILTVGSMNGKKKFKVISYIAQGCDNAYVTQKIFW